jgi:hypothetical protein
MDSKQFSTPILFLIFNRPDVTAKVFERIRALQPKKLFVSADGPRPGKVGERERCIETRKIIEGIDWDCDLKTRFSDTNLGCKMGVSSGISWFFENVEEGIILEDDCCPDASFFPYCRELLERYRQDDRIMQIGGVNFQDDAVRGEGSYYFVKIVQIWGWATWRRAWNKFDVRIPSCPEFLDRRCIELAFPDKDMQQYWSKKFKNVHDNLIDTWDIQWQYACSINNGLIALPNVNLVSNIGFNGEATHTVDSYHEQAGRPTQSLSEIVHPKFFLSHPEADRYYFRTYACPNKFKKLWMIVRRWYSKKKKR